MGIPSMYNFRCDPDLDIGKADCRQIPCAYLAWLEILNIPWEKESADKEKPRYGVNERYLYWKNFKGYNNWKVVDLITTNVDTEDEEKEYETIVHGIEARIIKRILIGTFSAMRTSDEATQWYFLLKWITEPYTVQENTVMKVVEPQ